MAIAYIRDAKRSIRWDQSTRCSMLVTAGDAKRCHEGTLTHVNQLEVVEEAGEV